MSNPWLPTHVPRFQAMNQINACFGLLSNASHYATIFGIIFLLLRAMKRPLKKKNWTRISWQSLALGSLMWCVLVHMKSNNSSAATPFWEGIFQTHQLLTLLRNLFIPYNFMFFCNLQSHDWFCAWEHVSGIILLI